MLEQVTQHTVAIISLAVALSPLPITPGEMNSLKQIKP